MVTPPLYCCLLPLIGQMERGKAQGDSTSMVAPFPLPRTRAQVVQHNSAQSCPPLSNSPQFSPNRFISSSTGKKKKSFLYLLIDCSVNFSQANWISHFLTFQELLKWNEFFICRIQDSNLRGVQGDTEGWRFLRKWIGISSPTWKASVEGGT